jgi:hypothetical protein
MFFVFDYLGDFIGMYDGLVFVSCDYQRSSGVRILNYYFYLSMLE